MSFVVISSTSGVFPFSEFRWLSLSLPWMEALPQECFNLGLLEYHWCLLNHPPIFTFKFLATSSCWRWSKLNFLKFSWLKITEFEGSFYVLFVISFCVDIINLVLIFHIWRSPIHTLCVFVWYIVLKMQRLFMEQNCERLLPLSFMLPTANLPATFGILRWESWPAFALKSPMIRSLCLAGTKWILSWLIRRICWYLRRCMRYLVRRFVTKWEVCLLVSVLSS